MRRPFAANRGTGFSRISNVRHGHVGTNSSGGDGFTIIEVMVAVGLTSLLMAAMYTAMSVYWSTAVESYDEIERSQIARALLREMARDIQSCTFVEAQVMASSSDDDSGSGDSEVVDVDTAMASYTNGLFGTDRDLVLYVSRPDPNQNYVSAQDLASPAERSSDGMIIRYFLAEQGGGGLSGMMADEALTNSRSSSNVAGLARMRGDLIGLSTAISRGDVDMQMDASDMLAEEVVDINFLYFDGVEEVEEWDSTVQNAMPLAIVIELTLRTIQAESDTRNPEDTPGMLSDTKHRLVVPVPVAEPYVGEDSI